MAMVCHHCVDSLTIDQLKVRKLKEIPVTIGMIPKIVVIAVNMTGRRRVAPAATMASTSSYPRSRNLLV